MTSKMEIEYGNQVWRNQNGELHCLDGPAIIRPNGYQAWYVDGLRHRIDSPAMIDPNGRTEYWIRGNNITVQVNEWLLQNNKSYPFDRNTQILFKLTFGN